MKSSIALSDKHPAATGRPRLINRAARALLLRQLGQMREGEIVLHEDHGHRFGHAHPDFPEPVQLFVTAEEFFGDTVFGGSVGAAEAYMAGFWHCSNLVDLVRLLLRNRHVLDGMDGGLTLIAAPARKLIHALNRNSRGGSRRNIAAHYDLGNDFFRLFLDESMLYSCAYFEQPDMSLHDASTAKLERICQKLDLGPQDHVLEIGTGWGGFALHAASRYGCRVTTTTLSSRQREWARERVRDAGLADRITLLGEDYRDLSGTYDKLVSIEMIEAVGHQYYDSYFRKCAALLKPRGLALIQAITIADQEYRRARDEVDFIKRYIFPGSCIPSITALLDAATRASDLTLIGLEDIGAHYAVTLRRWREAFLSQRDAVRQQGYCEEFIRMWEFYLAYCEGGFTERALSDVHMLLAKPRCRGH